MILLVIPVLILSFGGFWGLLYVSLGVLSLSLDWFLFYKPYFKNDYSILSSEIRSNYPNLSTMGELEEKMIADISFQYMKKNILYATIQSLGWWPLTSWRWLVMLSSKNYRGTVGASFVEATILEMRDGMLYYEIKSELHKINVNNQKL
jgi:hypothetical protein